MTAIDFLDRVGIGSIDAFPAAAQRQMAAFPIIPTLVGRDFIPTRRGRLVWHKPGFSPLPE